MVSEALEAVLVYTIRLVRIRTYQLSIMAVAVKRACEALFAFLKTLGALVGACLLAVGRDLSSHMNELVAASDHGRCDS